MIAWTLVEINRDSGDGQEMVRVVTEFKQCILSAEVATIREGREVYGACEELQGWSVTSTTRVQQYILLYCTYHHININYRLYIFP